MGIRSGLAVLLGFSVAGLLAQGKADHAKALRLTDEALQRHEEAEAQFLAAEQLWRSRHDGATAGAAARALRAQAAFLNRQADRLIRAAHERRWAGQAAMDYTVAAIVGRSAGLAFSLFGPMRSDNAKFAAEEEAREIQERGEKEINDAVKMAMRKQLAPAPAPWLAEGRRTLALIGPTGVGKTTAIAKIAARALLETRFKVALLRSIRTGWERVNNWPATGRSWGFPHTLPAIARHWPRASSALPGPIWS